ncbi:hypothetical protein JR316_0013134 [Psilocybe cubensis]|uniref:Uncharacterized protein n=1 Tax=Psilocybe cubensis TaxID=181762 RepID=A0ACB8GG39_PSICU|nr:hypothetical protein JR316_0013134 [Psilocybe cubensis]KAH9474670.1 hypothetical protein JR316_0013134 [Psilocybe cubensis]
MADVKMLNDSTSSVTELDIAAPKSKRRPANKRQKIGDKGKRKAITDSEDCSTPLSLFDATRMESLLKNAAITEKIKLEEAKVQERIQILKTQEATARAAEAAEITKRQAIEAQKTIQLAQLDQKRLLLEQATNSAMVGVTMFDMASV